VTDREVLWTDAAVRDLDEIVDFIACDAAPHALDVFERLQRCALGLEVQAQRGRRVPELCGLAALDYRELIERPWRLVYRVEPRRVIVLAVLDGRRDLATLLLERLIRP
jgi:toxin ParE1/3/4